jgi:hypothetical protein
VAVKFGDPSGKYAAFLASKDQSYPGRPWFLWNQPLSDSGLAVKFVPDNDDGGNGSVDPDNNTSGTVPSNGASSARIGWGLGLVGAFVGIALGL